MPESIPDQYSEVAVPAFIGGLLDKIRRSESCREGRLTTGRHQSLFRRAEDRFRLERRECQGTRSAEWRDKQTYQNDALYSVFPGSPDPVIGSHVPRPGGVERLQF
ncbi:hypothetical protein [Comamonas thiooxydans]|uniref:hypothetical protein n=1 Tax=Comamonas thiooxydans TaxID=363952 RepID=UPI0013DA7710|nr:hypothetical protein [Comamonas thiooxydans]UUE95290.1 hypothetical protein MJ608_06525 [Comamonas thiooxydans]